MFGVLEGLLGFFRRQVGIRTDSANAQGSLHAKVKHLADVKLGDMLVDWKNSVPRASLTTANSSNYVTVCNINGSGFLTGIAAWPDGTRIAMGMFKVTIDGVVILQDFVLGRKYYAIYDSPTPREAIDNAANSLPFFHRFKYSLLVEAKSHSDSSNVNCDCVATYIVV